MKLTDLCPICWGAKGRCCNNTGLRIESIHGKPTQALMIEDLKRRRVEFWRAAHDMPDDDERKEKVIQAARNIYDTLVKLGVKVI